jgi:hypothetical protein
MDLVILVSNKDQRINQTMLKNMLPRYDMMVCGILKCTYTHSKKSLEVSSATILFLQVVIMVILKNRPTTTNTKSL